MAHVVACHARVGVPPRRGAVSEETCSSPRSSSIRPSPGCRRRDLLLGSLVASQTKGFALETEPANAADLAAYLLAPTDRSLDVDAIDVNALPEGWTTLESGVAFIVDRESEGNVERGITDTVDHYIPQPFVEVAYTAYTASDGHAFASSSAARRAYNYQAGVKDEVQDESFGGVMGMKVGEKRRFVVPGELCFKRKVFGQYLPRSDGGVLVDVELLSLQPY